MLVEGITLVIYVMLKLAEFAIKQELQKAKLPTPALTPPVRSQAPPAPQTSQTALPASQTTALPTTTLPTTTPPTLPQTPSTPTPQTPLPTNPSFITRSRMRWSAAILTGVIVVVIGWWYHKKRNQKTMAYTPVGLPMVLASNKNAESKLDLSKLVIQSTLLGRGRYADVFLGTIEGCEFAVKVSKKTSLEADQDFEKEMAICVKIMTKIPKQENLAQVFGTLNTMDRKCVVMHRYQGRTLKTELDSCKEAFNKPKYLKILWGIAKGLMLLHEKNIVHRYLAARNILLEGELAVITDFGLSRECDPYGEAEYKLTPESAAVAARWLPPETLVNRKSIVKSDVWSFGVVAWEVITQGMTPLQQFQPHEIERIAKEEPQGTLSKMLLNEINNRDLDFVELVRMCLVHDPNRRPRISTVAAKIDDLLHPSIPRLVLSR